MKKDNEERRNSTSDPCPEPPKSYGADKASAVRLQVLPDRQCKCTRKWQAEG